LLTPEPPPSTRLSSSTTPLRIPGSTPLPYTTLFRSKSRHHPPSPGPSPSASPGAAFPNRFPGSFPLSVPTAEGECDAPRCPGAKDRKSTRLNSSHVKISYAVFCLKNKKLHPDHERDY